MNTVCKFQSNQTVGGSVDARNRCLCLFLSSRGALMTDHEGKASADDVPKGGKKSSAT